MGGGDLNLKKKWHTQTMKNLEKVWLAEQKVEEENKRIEELLKERATERERTELRQLQERAGLITPAAERLDWMYSGPSSKAIVDEEQEAYLLGRIRVDRPNPKGVLGEGSIAKPLENPMQHVTKFTGLTVENEQRDLQTKIREDPLFAIKMKEKEIIDSVRSNPLKVKKLMKEKSSSSSTSGSSNMRRRSRSRSPPPRSGSKYDDVDGDYRRRRRHHSRSPSPPSRRERSRDHPYYNKNKSGRY
jgi:hypothetical protein